MDRTPIDWTALLRRVRDPGERTFLQTLQYLDDLRSRPGPVAPSSEPCPRTLVLHVLLAVGAVQTACGLANAAVAVATGHPVGHVVPQLLLASTFASAGLLLASASPRDQRILFLLATFILCASAFARAALTGLPGQWPPASSVLFGGVYPEAFAQATLWRFAVLFPAVRRFTSFDMFARRAAAIAWWLASFLALANLLMAYGILEEPLAILGRDHPLNLFWHLFAAAALPAVATILIRACRAPRSERRKVVRFACAIGAGAAPFLLTGMARMVLPQVDRWMLTASASARLWIDVTVLGGLAAMPVMTTLAVIIDRPFELQAIVPAAVRGWIARIDLRRQAAGRLRSLRRQPYRERLTAALDRVRLARGPRETAAVLRRELQFSLGAGSVRILDVSDLPAGTALVPVLEESSAPTDLSRDREPFILLPRRDREWLEANGVALAAPMRLRDGTIGAVTLLGARRGQESFDRADRWFIATLLSGAAAAWDTPVRRRGLERAPDDVALECARCGQVGDVGPLSCGCRSGTILAALPHRIGDKFIVMRRLGAGGMGVVYLGRDTTLGRDVALKTLPALRDGMVSRLRDEARAMAALNHESLATIYGLELWRRTPVLVVEYFPRGTLADTLAGDPMPLGDVLAIGVRLADALTYMHARGVLHRDLKPGNIGLTADGAPKLLDFGLATEYETPAGTPEYLPPEALAGAPPDVAVDLWGLSTVLLNACGGRDEAPEALAAFFDRALAPAPGARFRSSTDLRAALSSIAVAQRLASQTH